MDPNTKLEIAVELIASKIADSLRKSNGEFNEEVLKHIKEREELYSGNQKVIDMILKEYGKKC